jgi:hypothetical protein
MVKCHGVFLKHMFRVIQQDMFSEHAWQFHAGFCSRSSGYSIVSFGNSLITAAISPFSMEKTYQSPVLPGLGTKITIKEEK